MRKNSVKNTRINGEVQKALAQIIRSEIKDPRIHPFTSVVKVEVSPDLKTAKAWISVLGDEAAGKATCEGLASAEGFIRSRLANMVNLRNTPQFRFLPDASIAYGVDMSKKIADVIEKDSQERQKAANRAREEQLGGEAMAETQREEQPEGVAMAETENAPRTGRESE